MHFKFVCTHNACYLENMLHRHNHAYIGVNMSTFIIYIPHTKKTHANTSMYIRTCLYTVIPNALSATIR